MMRGALAIVIAALSVSPALAGDRPIFSLSDQVIVTNSTITIVNDSGGNIHDYVEFIESDIFAIRITGTCRSSCTMFLTAPRVCVETDALFGFHGPRSANHADDPVYMRGLVDKIADNQPEAIGQRFRADWSTSRDLSWLTGAEVVALAPEVPLCADGEQDDE